MPSPLIIYHLLILAVLIALLGIVIVNLWTLPNLTKHTPLHDDHNAPLVAVLIPARNEAANIEECLRTLLAQDYPHYQVWIYDDASTDATVELALKFVEQDRRVHIISGTNDPPPGWLGKANACHQLYLAMKAQYNPVYLLFTDADVRFGSGALSYGTAALQARNAGLLSIFPRQLTLSWAERLAVPTLLHWAVFTFLPLPLAFSMRTGPAFAAANGQFMLFTSEAYEACGGHETVRSEILEDVALARAVKRAGHKSILADGGPLVQTRMYNGPSEVWQGYSKNVYAFFGYSPFFLAIGLAVLTALYIAPPVLAFYSALSPQPSALVYLPLAQYTVAVLGRMLLMARFAYRPLGALLHPIATIFMAAIAINSMLWSLTGKGAWKGRAASKPSRASQS